MLNIPLSMKVDNIVKMNNEEVQELVKYVFQKLEAAETIDHIENILNDSKVYKIKKNKMDEETYPKLHFKITAEELKTADFLTDDKTFSIDISKLELNPLTKLLYAICWKNGDLKKVKHIIQGITSNQTDLDDKNDGLVFYQFGKYLSKQSGEPIIDQHVLRAFSLLKAFKANRSDDCINQIRSKSIITKKDKELINDYKEWLATKLKEELREIKDYCYYIDKLLFALGKTIKAK